MRRFLISILFGLLTLQPLMADAATYTVSQDGSGKDYSVATFNALTGTGNAGDTFTFSGATTSQIIPDISGTSGNEVTLAFDGTFDHSGRVGSALYISGEEHLIIDGFKIDADGITSGNQMGINIVNGSNNIKIINGDFKNLYGGVDDDGAGININGAGATRVSYITIGESGAGNTFYQIGTDTGAGDITIEDVEDIYIGHNVMEGTTTAGIDGIVFLGSDRGLIEYNKITNHLDATGSDLGEDGIDLKGSHDVIIRYNYIAGNRVKGLNINVNEAGSAGYIATTDVYAYGNFFAGNNSHIAMSGSGGFTNLSDIYIWANILDQTTNDNYPGIYTNGYASAPVKIYNNTLYKANGTVDTSEDTPIYASNDPFDIRNCIIYSQTLTRVVGSYSNTTMTVDNGVYYSTGGSPLIRYDGVSEPALDVDTNGYVGDPLFVSAASGNLTLSASSPCRDTGVTITGGPPSMTIQGVSHSPTYDIALDPDTDWSATLNSTNIKTKDQDSEGTGWEVGAYVYDETATYDFEQEASGNYLVTMEAEEYSANNTYAPHSWTFVTSPANYSGTGAMQALPNSGVRYSSGFAPLSSPRLDFDINFVTTGTHYVWIRGWGINGGGDSCHVGLDQTAVNNASDYNFDPDLQWIWSNDSWYTGAKLAASVSVGTTGVHTLNVWMREDGFIIDKIIMTTSSSYTPTGTGDQNVLIEGLNPVTVEGLVGFTIEGLQ